jgi:AbrB family looped-hinge helix DNA binding protein
MTVRNMSSQIERRVDSLGRVVIPADMRRALGLFAYDAVTVELRAGAIVLMPALTADDRA